MTMILTQASSLGIAMAADSAATFPDGRVLVGVQKLFQVNIKPYAAGLAIWGLAQFNGKYADFWIQENIIEKFKGCPKMSLIELANEVAAKLNIEFKQQPAPERIGVHVAGFDELHGITGTAIYHVINSNANVVYTNGKAAWVGDPPGLFSVQRTFNPVRMAHGHFYHLRNGDITIFAPLFNSMHQEFAKLEAITGLQFPSPNTLQIHGEYVRFWVSLVRNIYKVSDKAAPTASAPSNLGESSIGGPITVLTISENGVESFYAA